VRKQANANSEGEGQGKSQGEKDFGRYTLAQKGNRQARACQVNLTEGKKKGKEVGKTGRWKRDWERTIIKGP